uniref:WSC domain-containing protein n=1 Tax=Macrostomum lignano TaxID=282301 RepID=A0A1I8HDI4_9PLAT
MQTLSILPLILCCCIAFGHSLGTEFGLLGCFVDTATRDVNGLDGWSTIGPYSVTWSSGGTVTLSSMTVQLCIIVSAETHMYGRHGRAADSHCNMACAGNSAQICGGADRNSVYRQIYYRPEGEYFTHVDRDYVNVTSTSGPFYRTEQPVRSLVECVYRCEADCQAVLFHLDACHLLRFPVLPHELKTVAGKFAIRV